MTSKEQTDGIRKQMHQEGSGGPSQQGGQAQNSGQQQQGGSIPASSPASKAKPKQRPSNPDQR